MLATTPTGSPGPSRLEDPERLVEHSRALAVVELLARDRVLAGELVAPEPDAQGEAAVAQPITGRSLARDLGRAAPRERGDHRPEPDALGRGGELVEGRDVEAEAHQVCSRIAATIASQSAR